MGIDPTVSRCEIGLPGHKGWVGCLAMCLEAVQSLWKLRQGPNFTSTYCGVNACLAQCLNSVLNVKALVGAFNQEKALVGAFSVIVQLHRWIDLRH